MNEALISVVVPVYNVERYLAACLDSILNQSYRNMEVIVINDGSTDYSLQIAEKYAEKDDRVKVYSFDNEGLSEARNRGIAVATGKFLTFVDSDDMLFPDALEIMMATIEKEGADMVEGSVVRGKSIIDFKFPKSIEKFEYTTLEAITDVLYQKRLLPSSWGKLYKKDLFEDLRFEKGILYEDLNIFYKILERCNKIVWISRPVYFYRVAEGSIINTWKPQRLDVLQVTENIENYIRERYPEILPAAQDRRLSANFNMFSLCSINGDHENAALCWKLIKERRLKALKDPKVRLKNKAGALLSFLGKPVFNLAARRIYQ